MRENTLDAPWPHAEEQGGAPGNPDAVSIWLYRVGRVLPAVVFLYAGVMKISAPREFAALISEYGLLPEPLLPVAAIGLPAFEILAGAALLFDLKGSLTSIALLLAMFIGILWFGVLSGLDVDCGCFSASEQAEHDTLRVAMVRDMALLVLCATLYGWRWAYHRKGTPWRRILDFRHSKGA